MTPPTPVRDQSRFTHILTIACLLILGACGPSGPGMLEGRISAEGIGGVVLEVEGNGIQGFAGRGDSRVYSAPMPNRPTTHRVVLIHPSGGEMVFEVAVDDVGMDPPIARVVSATRVDNTLVTVGGIEVVFSR